MNMLIMQMLLEINSRQLALQGVLVTMLSEHYGTDAKAILQAIEDRAAALRVDFVTDTYGQFGEISPEILDLLKKPPDRNSPL